MTEREILAAEYALRLLDSEDMLRARGLISADPAFAAMVTDWEAKLAPLLDEIASVEPGTDLWPRIEAALGQQSRGEVMQLRRSVRRWQWGTGLSAAAAVVLAVVSMHPPATPASAPVAAPLAATLAPKGGGAVTLVWQPDLRRLTALAPELPLSAGHDYELWVLPKNEISRSLGLLKAGANRQMVMSAELAAKLGPNVTVAISLEQTGGSPNPEHTGPVIAVGKISAS